MAKCFTTKRAASLAILFFIGSFAQAAEQTGAPAEVNLLVVGDLGYTPEPGRSPNTKRVAQAMGEYVRASKASFNAAVVPGDMFKVKLAGPEDKAFRTGFEEMYDPKVLSMPFYLVAGNHDYDAPAVAAELAYSAKNPESRWKMPARWYRVDLPARSPLVTLLMLDSNKDKLSADDWKSQIKWLTDELAKPRAAWTICCAHKPAFSDGAHGDSRTIQTEFGPLLKKHNVDFYLSGHDHVLDHHQPEGWKTTFIVSGGGGENTVRPVNGHTARFSKAMPGFVHLRFTPQSAVVFFIDDKCKTIYSFERTPDGQIRAAAAASK